MGDSPIPPFCGETPHPLRKSTQKRQKINNNHEINHAEITNPDIDQETIQINKVLSCVTPKTKGNPYGSVKSGGGIYLHILFMEITPYLTYEPPKVKKKPSKDAFQQKLFLNPLLNQVLLKT